jgi:hypothetical protein
MRLNIARLISGFNPRARRETRAFDGEIALQ